LKKLPLPTEVQEKFNRILTGKDELEKPDDRFTDYLIYLEQIKQRRLVLHRDNDYANYSKFCFVGPDGILHKKPSADPKHDTRFYERVKNQRIGSPRTVGIKNRNNVKRVRSIELMGKNVFKHQETNTASKKCEVDIERSEVPITSPHLERFRHKVLDLQDDYHSAQKKVNQLSRELQIRTNKPEYQRRCSEIRKELCDKIDDTVWKQKKYERENSKLQKMVARRTFTRIERAFGADASSSTPLEISTSYDLGAVTKGTVKLSTKEKIYQLRAMLSELEDEVQEGQSSDIQWDNSDSDDEKKPAAIPVTSAQAKLAKELIKLANTYKVPELTFTEKATKRRFNYQTCFTKL
jgi:hypothetical protein